MRYRTLNEVALALGVSYHTVRSWRLQGCPGKPGEYDADAIRSWRESRRPPTPKQIRAAAVAELAKLFRSGGEMGENDRLQFYRQHTYSAAVEMIAEAKRLAATPDLDQLIAEADRLLQEGTPNA